MNNYIWKYKCSWDFQDIEMPAGAEILTAQIQNNEIYLWALFSPSNAVQNRRFRAIGTGQEITEPLVIKDNYIATVQDDYGYVWHIFEVTE